MKVNVDLADYYADGLWRLGVNSGYKRNRKDANKPWTEPERRSAIRFAIARLIEEADKTYDFGELNKEKVHGED